LIPWSPRLRGTSSSPRRVAACADTLTPDEIERAVIRAIREGGRERMVLWPSANPHERHTNRFTANARRYIETALEHGKR
jgi:hypothetical protein